MKKAGTINTYKNFPLTSLSYKLQKLNSLKNTIDGAIFRLAGLPVRVYAYYKIGDAYFSPTFTIASIGADILFMIFEAINLSKNSKELKEMKKNIVEHLSKIEPNVLPDENVKQQLQKRI